MNTRCYNLVVWIVVWTYFVCSFEGVAQQVYQYPLRSFGTNTFDFSPLIRSFQRGEISNSICLITGQVVRVSGDTISLHRRQLRLQLSDEFRKQVLMASPGEMLKLAYAQQLIEKWQKGQMSAGEFLALETQTRRIILEEIEREKRDVIEVNVTVNNVPTNFFTIGDSARLLALPKIKADSGSATVKSDQISLLFDYGTPLPNNFEVLSNRFLVTAQGIVRKETPQEVSARKIAQTAKVIASQEKQATNGVAYAQFEIGKRYYYGDGVQKDESLGIHWMTQAALQQYEPAKALLQKIDTGK